MVLHISQRRPKEAEGTKRDKQLDLCQQQFEGLVLSNLKDDSFSYYLDFQFSDSLSGNHAGLSTEEVR